MLLSHPHRCREESAIAPHADGKIRFEVVVVDKLAIGDVNVYLVLEVIVERTVNERNDAASIQRIEEFYGCLTLFGLIRVPKDGTSYCFFDSIFRFRLTKVRKSL